MDRHQVRFALLKITILVLLGTTWVFWSFVYASRPEQAQTENTLDALIRLPASLPAQFAPTTKTLPPIDMNVMKVPCWDMQDLAVKDTDARWIRLTGKACQLKEASENVTVRNLSNGHVATVFTSKGEALTTDFIPLQIGKNEIMIRFESGPGVSLESHFTFLRE